MIDSDLILWFNTGVGIGLVILTTLLLFPGVEQKGSVKGKVKHGKEGTDDDRTTGQAIDSTQSSFMDEDVDRGQYAFTPYQKMNFVVYAIIFVVSGVILDREYGGMLGVWLRFYFPKEAAILGYVPLIERVRR